MKISIHPRQNTNSGQKILILLLSLLGGFLLVGIVFLLKKVNPFYAMFSIFKGSFGTIYGIKETITKAIPLILIGAGLTLVFRGKFWNIGAEGQLLIGAAFSTWIALNVGDKLPAVLVIPMMFTAGFLGGAIWAAVPALLKAKFSINEVITTLMFNYISFEIIKYLIIGPWKGPTQSGFPYTDNFAPAATLGLMPGSRIHTFTLAAGLILAAVLFIIIFRTRFGYEIRVIGENPEAAGYAGISVFKTTMTGMVISGGMAGIAGMGEVAAIHHHLTYPGTISAGYGFTAIIVAWLARLNPLLAVVSSLFFAGLIVGGDAIQISLNLPAATVNVFNGILLFSLIIGEYFQNYEIRFERGR